MTYETFRVRARDRAPLVEFMVEALRKSGCAILNRSREDEAPFRISFLTPWGERMGVLAYAFYANTRETRNRPGDEWRFQIKYGSKAGRYHRLWQDPFGLYTTILVGISPEHGFFVGADPVLNSPTLFFISKEFKQEHVDAVMASGWHAWARDVQPTRRRLARAASTGLTESAEARAEETFADGHETLIGATADNFLRFVLFEREVLGEDQGHRQLVAERFSLDQRPPTLTTSGTPSAEVPSVARLHTLEREFDLRADRLLEIIASAPRLKMAVRGWVAEEHLHAQLSALPDVESVSPIEQDGRPDFEVRLRGRRRSLFVECKNVLRITDASGHPRLDFMRTRASPADPCSRYYSPQEFDVVAACLHARTERWEFAARATAEMAPHRKCPGRLAHRIVIDEGWSRDLALVLREAAS
jgi:hypothetical protein